MPAVIMSPQTHNVNQFANLAGFIKKNHDDVALAQEKYNQRLQFYTKRLNDSDPSIHLQPMAFTDDPTNAKRLQRTQSAPSQTVQPQQQPTMSNTSRYKTELCRTFEESNQCKYGDKCQFAHGHAELRNLARHPKYKTELCRTFHTDGICPYGNRCHFVHNEVEARQGEVSSPPPQYLPATLAQSHVPLTAQHSAVPPLPIHPPTPVANVLACRQRPVALSPTLSLGSLSDGASSSLSSLSQSPTSSMGSFFSEDYLCPTTPPFSTPKTVYNIGLGSHVQQSPVGSSSPSPPPPLAGLDALDQWRLPVFNSLSLQFNELALN